MGHAAGMGPRRLTVRALAMPSLVNTFALEGAAKVIG